MSQAAELQSTFDTLQSIYYVKLAGVSASVWLLWDILITLDQEVTYIWRSHWTLPKVLYLATRYYGLFNTIFNTVVPILPNLSVSFCSSWSWFIGFSGAVFFTTTVNFIFLLRLRALYHRNRKALIFLTILYVAEFFTEVTVTVITIKNVHMKPIPAGLPLTGCYSSNPSRLTLVSWIPCLAVACIFFAFTLYQFILALQDEENKLAFASFRHREHVRPVVSLFVRDGAIFFALIFAVMLINTVFNVIGGVLGAAGIPWLMAGYSIAGSRLVLNIRGILSHNRDGLISNVTRVEVGPPGARRLHNLETGELFAMSNIQLEGTETQY